MGDSVWWHVFGWIGSAVLLYSLMQTHITRLRIFNLIGCVLAIAYNAALDIWPSVGLNIALAIVNVVHLRRIRNGVYPQGAPVVVGPTRGAQGRTEAGGTPTHESAGSTEEAASGEET